MRLVVVPTDAEALAEERAGRAAEPVRRFVERMAGRFCPREPWATELECRLVVPAPRAEGGAAAPSARDLHAAIGVLRGAPGALAPLEAIGGRPRGGGPTRAKGKRPEPSLFEEPSTTARRARALLDAMEETDARLARAGLVDPRLVHAKLAAALARAEPEEIAAAVGADEVTVRGVLDLSPAALAWLGRVDEALARARRGRLSVALPAVDAAVDADREKTPFELVADLYERGLEGALVFYPVAPILGDGRFTGPVPDEARARVAIVRALESDREHASVADVVEEALAAGAREDRVVVAVPPGSAALERAIVRELAARGIAVAAPDRDLEDSGILALVRRALDLAYAFDRVALADVVESGYVSARSLTADRAATPRALRALAEELRARRVLHAEGDLACAAVAARIEAERDAPLAAVAARRLAAAYADLGRARTRGATLAAIARVVTTLGVAERAAVGGYAFFADDGAPSGVARAEAQALARDARAWDAFASHLEAYESAARRARVLAEPTSPREVVEEIFSTLGAVGVRSGARAFAVRVVGARALGVEPLDLLVVARAIDGATPSGDGGVLSEALAAEVCSRARGPVLPLPRTTAAQATLGLLAATAAAARTVFVYSARDEGAATAPAPVVAWLERGGAPVSTAPHAPAVAAERDPEGARARARIEAIREGYFLDPKRPAGPEVGALADDPASRAVLSAATGGGEHPLSVSGLERFASCPFAGFAAEVLRARDEPLVGERVDAREEGTLAHEALCVAFRAARDLLAARERDAGAVVEAGLRAAALQLEGGSLLERLEAERILDGVRAHLELAAADDEWRFELGEQGFGGSSDPWPPIELEAEGERLRLRGRVDRIDVGRSRAAARAVDYKRSRSQAEGALRKAGDTVFQVPLYALHAARRLGVGVARGAYLPTTRRNLEAMATPTAKAEARFASLVDARAGEVPEIERLAVRVVGRVRAGRILPAPVDEGTCRTCAASGGCRRPRFTMKADDDAGEEGGS